MFLTEIDSRAKVKGSRDPLGLVPFWSHFGRQVVGNLTTVTTSVRGFTTILLGYHFAAEVRDRQGEDAETVLALFLKFEQLAGYCRLHVKGDGDFRGIERVSRNLGESTSVHLSDRHSDQILSNQRVYGLWGLYSSPSRASGLLEPEEPVLTPTSQNFVESRYLNLLSEKGLQDGREFIDLLRRRRSKVELDGRHQPLASALAEILTAPCQGSEAVFYRDHLLFGGPEDVTEGRQRQLAKLMAHGFLGEPGFDRQQLRALVKMAAQGGEALVPLADRLQRIDDIESLLIPADASIWFLLARHGQTPASVAREFKAAWGPHVKGVDSAAIRKLTEQIADAFHDQKTGERWGNLADALASGDYEAWIRLLMQHNAWVMDNRGGSSPWLRVKAGKVDVRVRNDATNLPTAEEMPHLWWHNYFLDSLKAVTVELGGRLMADIPTSVLSEHFQEHMEGWRLRTGVFFTFRLDPGFFEQEVLPVFLDLTLSHEPAVRLVQLEDAVREKVDHLTVYYDRGGLDPEGESARLDVQRIPVAWPTGIFHPKNVLLLLEEAEPEDPDYPEEKLLVATMSANLTRAGWWENVEVCHVEELRVGEKTRLRGDLRRLIKRVKEACPTGTDHSALEAIRRFVVSTVERQKASAGGILAPRLYLGLGDEGAGQRSVPEFLADIRRRRLRGANLEVISPYFDGTGEAGALAEFIEWLDPRQVRVYLPTGPDGKALCRQDYFEAVSQLPRTSWAKLPGELLRSGKDESAAPRFVHAKVYRFFDPGERYEALFVGSVNLTHAAHSRGGNLETAFLIENECERRPRWWLEVEESEPKHFDEGGSEDEGLSEGPGRALLVRYSWDTGQAEARWEAQEPSPRLAVSAQGSPLFEVGPLKPEAWVALGEDETERLASVLKSTSFLTVSAEGEEPATILVLEEGMAHKPSILLNLSVSDILKCWAALRPEQKEALLAERYGELGQTLSALVPAARPDKLETESLFDQFAGAFHAFASLERKVLRALEAGREKEAVYLLFGQKYDSLPRLLHRLGEEETRLDDLNRYVLVLCARQVLDRLKKEDSDFHSAHRDEVREVEGQLKELSKVRESLSVGPGDDRDDFLSWYEAWFLKRAQPLKAEGST